jgi:hypothetical protein
MWGPHKRPHCGRVGGQEEDEEEGRSGDWLKIGEMSKKRSSQKLLHRRLVVWCPSVSVGEIVFIRPSRDPTPPPAPQGLQL